MSGVNIFLTILSACGTICAIIFGYIAYKRNGRSDNKSGVDDIKRKQEKQDDQIGKVVERLSSVESSAKQAHHRIDTIEQQLYKK